MPIAAPIQSNFSGGEIAPLVQGRVDFDTYKKSVALMLNWIATLQGPPIRRPGTVYVAEAKTSTRGIRLLPFVFSNSQAYIIEMGHLYARFYTQEGQLLQTSIITGITQANPAAVTSTAHGFVTGMTVSFTNVLGMTQINGLSGVITVTGANSFTVAIDSTAFTAYSSSGTATGIQEIVTPYQSALLPAALPPPIAASDLDTIYFAQSADVLYLAHPKYPPQKITRLANGTFTIAEVNFLAGPVGPDNTTAITLSPNATTGSATITASAPLFASTDVGRIIRIEQGTVAGAGKINAFSSSTSVNVTIQVNFLNTTAVTTWALGLWKNTNGWPACVTFHENRSWWAGSSAAPQRADSSNLLDFENMAPTEGVAGVDTQLAENGVSVDISSQDINQIVWMASNQKGLLVGTLGAEFLITPGSTSDFISPLSAFARRQSTHGSAPIQPMLADRTALYVQRAGLKIRESNFFFVVDGFESEDITILNNKITASGVKGLAFTREPFPILWAVRNDGVLVGATYQRDTQGVRVAWHRHIIGGRSTASGDEAIVRTIANIPTNTAPPGAGFQDELWMSVDRVINGTRKQYIEYMAPFFDRGPYALPVGALHLDSLASRADGYRITAATRANPCVITLDNAPTFIVGDTVTIDGVIGMTQLNGRRYIASVIAGSDVTLQDPDAVNVNSSAYDVFREGLPGSRFGFLFPTVSTISVGARLEGESIALLADAAPQAAATIASGARAVSPAAGFIVWGFPYNSDLKLLRMDAGSQNGTSVGKTQAVHRSAMQIDETAGLKVGMDFTTMQAFNPPIGAAIIGSLGPALATGTFTFQPPGAGKNMSPQICIRADTGLPATILAVAPQLETQDRA